MVTSLGLLVAVAVTPFAAPAQLPTRVPRIGYLHPGSLAYPEIQAAVDAFRRGLREHGHVEGQNVAVEYRAAEGRVERLSGLAAELTRLNVNLIVAVSTPAVRAARDATASIPIVGVNMGDPVRDGLVASLARPGGNVTGTTFLGPELVPKRFELLKEALPGVSRVALLWHPGAFGDQTMREMLKETEASARALGLHLRRVDVHGPDEFEHAFARIARERDEAVFVSPSPMLFSERARVVALATKHRLPLLGNAMEFAQIGGLISYGASPIEGTLRSAAYVDRILKGARPGDIPVQQPTTFELGINLRTAKALGLTLPAALRLRANHVIE